MRFVVKRLLLGLVLIISASAALLLSDLGRRSTSARNIPHVGLLQHASTMLLDEGTRGAIDGLAANGFIEGKTIVIDKFNAQGDISVGSSIAKEMVNARYDLLLTMSTLSLQAVANANRGDKTIQVFGLVADPVVAGVGISRDNPLNHPRNLVGIGSFLPVQDAFRIAREMFPSLKRVGVAWNPAEANSRAFVEKARKVCQGWSIELFEANVENSNSVLEAEDSLVARGAEALWIGGDVTVLPPTQWFWSGRELIFRCSVSHQVNLIAGPCSITALIFTRSANKRENWPREFCVAPIRLRYQSGTKSLFISS